jgi:ketosteroid isomerase-like protein
MLNETEARQFAHHWVSAWNSHNLDAIMSHYASEVVLTSPVATKLLNDASGGSWAKTL